MLNLVSGGATRIFLLAYEGYWSGCWIMIPSASGGSINSVHGLLLTADARTLFSNHDVLRKKK